LYKLKEMEQHCVVHHDTEPYKECCEVCQSCVMM